jgi:acetate kinase
VVGITVARDRRDALMHVLVLNTGSSSLKLSLLDAEDSVVAEAEIEDWAGGDTDGELRAFVAAHGPAAAVGHRVVHGGRDFVGPVVVDDAVERALEALGPLAPLHQPRALRGVAAARSVLPDAVQVACFDTAFHAGMPTEATTYPLPAVWRDQWPIRRYGFHGLSHGYAVGRAATLLGVDRGGLRTVSCHLGAGASLCATAGGRSMDTTMGFTPLDGLVMASRSGAIDPGLVLWLVARVDGGVDAVGRGLQERSGLVGLAGGTGDMRDVVARRRDGDATASLAFDVYQHRLAAGIGAMVPAIGGLDVLVFTGGVGEHSSEVRADLGQRLAFLGVGVDAARNAATQPADRDISASGASVRTLVIRSREDLEIARQTRSLLRGAGTTGVHRRGR